MATLIHRILHPSRAAEPRAGNPARDRERLHPPSTSAETKEARAMSLPRRILIVEDEPHVRLVFRAALESDRLRVATAEDGAIALRRLEEGPTDLVLLDLQMPRMGGMELLRQLRDAGNDVPVVVVTAYPSEPNAARAMELGAIDFLTKPMTPEALRRVVSEVLDRHAPAYIEPAVAPEARPRRDTLTSAKRALNHRLFHRAKALLREAIKEQPGSAEPWYLLGVLHEVLDHPRAAAHAYRTSHDIDPDHEPTKVKLFER